MALSFDVAMNERAAVKSAKNLADSLEDIDKELDFVGKNKSLDQVEKDLEGVQKESDKAGKKIGTELDDGFDKARKGAQDFKEEANSTARESAASFDGSAESIGDAFQEVAANAFAGFGPLGAAAGIAAAAGLGTALSAITAQQEAVDALKEKFRDAYQSAAEDGRTFLNEAEIQSLAIEIFFDPVQREAAKKDAEKLGVDLQTAVRAQAGDQDALAAIIQAGNDKLEERTGLINTNTGAASGLVNQAANQDAILRDTIGKYESILGLTKENEQASKDVQDLKRTQSAEELDQIQRTKAASQERYEAMARSAQENYDRIADLYRNPIQATLKVNDVELRNYRPPIIQIEGRIQLPAGSRQLIQ